VASVARSRNGSRPTAGTCTRSTSTGDLRTREGNRAVVDAALERFGRLDAVVANAGFQHVAPVAEFPEDRWDALVALLLTSPVPPTCGHRSSSSRSRLRPRCTACPRSGCSRT
jgi:NAD(P)-dependent dehydrogenase (short-subunit alcohol dehydrogenase family)